MGRSERLISGIAQQGHDAYPERFANFGVEASGDERLTDWMVTHLQLAAWPSPEDAVLVVRRSPVEDMLVT